MIRGIWLSGQSDLTEAMDVRMEVFVEEQGFSREAEQDGRDRHCLHVLILDGKRPVATGRLYEEDGVYHIGRLAVRKEARGQRLGDMAMRMLIYKARDLGAGEIVVSAQVQAQPFYEKLGFVPRGEVYLDEHCPHQEMVLPADTFPPQLCQRQG